VLGDALPTKGFATGAANVMLELFKADVAGAEIKTALNVTFLSATPTRFDTLTSTAAADPLRTTTAEAESAVTIWVSSTNAVTAAASALLAANAGTVDIKPKPREATATSAMRLRSVFVDICFLSISRDLEFPELGFG
jgi:hypothetical protein